jgi:hypothetical protein
MLCVAGFALVAASCSQGQPAATTGGSTPGGGASLTGGTIGSSGGTISSSGGTTTIASGGSPQTGGNPVTGGNPLAGGNPVTGGVASSGGTTTGAGGTTTRSGGTISSSGGTISSSGGTATSSGGTTTSSGGTTTSSGGVTGTSTGGTTARTGGTTVSTGGTTTSTGGTTRTGGTTASTGGTTTSTGGAGGATTVDPATIVPQMDGFLWVGTCAAQEVGAGSLDCYLLPDGATTTTCPNATSATYATKGVIRTVTQTVGGTPGTQYTINFEMRGVLGSKCYSGGTRRAGNAPPANWNAEVNTDGWYEGGIPDTGLWNTYEIHVSPPVGTTNLTADKTENVYYLNSMPSTLGVTWCEVHETFPMQYTASFPVMGGGTIKFVLHDSNCKGQQNCGGPTPANCTTQHRTVDLTGMPTPLQTPPSPQQPYKDSNGHYPQWILFNVTSVTSQ